MKTPLPIDSLLPEALLTIERSPSLIVQATPGSGKTTRLPPYLLRQSRRFANSQIWVLQPRKLAAQWAAQRVAEEENEKLGDWVGYHFRFEKNFSDRTQLLYLTEGMLIRRMMSNPDLRGVGLVILDEFHERHLHTDLSLSFLKHLQQTSRPDLKILVMSATLELEQLKLFLDDAPVLQLNSPLFTVETHYLTHSQKDKPLSRKVKEAVQTQLKCSSQGDFLVFLPGLKEIRESETELAELSRSHHFNVFPLHGDFDKEIQERALAPNSKRKIILSTNLAETSLTIPGINCVIDSGLQRTASYSWWTGLPSLTTKQNSKASAIQRSGRAGRTGPGTCLRLYTLHEFETKAPFDIPEIRRADLTQTILELKALGIDDLSRFSWYEAPPQDSLNYSHKLLYFLGALTSAEGKSGLTSVGRQMKSLSAHPRISRFLLKARSQHCLDEALHLAALISENRLELLDARDHLNTPLDSLCLKTKRHLQEALRTLEPEAIHSDPKCPDALVKSLLGAFPDRCALAKNQSSSQALTGMAQEFVLSSGGTASLKAGLSYTYSKKQPYVIALALQEHKKEHYSKVHLTSLVPIEEEWLLELSPCPLEESHRTEWNKEKQKIESFSQLALGQIVLEKKQREIVNDHRSVEIFLKELFKTDSTTLKSMSLIEWLSVFKSFFTQDELEPELTKLSLFYKHLKLGLELNSSSLLQFMEQWLASKRSRAELTLSDCIHSLRTFFISEHHYSFEKHFPETLTLPNQRKIPIHYPWERAPWVESRMQDFFGLKEAPKICQGKVPITLHLLAPNYRAVQVTSDLKSFWEIHYPVLRKELSRNYPKHSWPENPYVPLPPRPPKKN